MLRTFNYTGRHKILQSEVNFEILEQKGQPPSFDVIFNINQRNMPPHAKLYIEARYKETRQRFDFGTLGHIFPPANRKLDMLDLTGTTSFCVLIVDESSKQGSILASGKGFKYDTGDDEGKSSLLTVKELPLDGLSWKLDFENSDNPELIVNKHIPNALDKMRSDPVFQALILPAAMNQILSRYLFSDHDMESEGFSKWVEFTQNFTDTTPYEMDEPEKMKWLDDVIEQFAERFEFSTRLINFYKDEET